MPARGPCATASPPARPRWRERRGDAASTKVTNGEGRIVVQQFMRTHRASGDTLLLTTATSRIVSELTARELGVDHYLCTEVEAVEGRFTGQVDGLPNMGTGKLLRLRAWLAANSCVDADLRHAV